MNTKSDQILGKFANTLFTMKYDKPDWNNESFIESFRPKQVQCKWWLTREISYTKAHFNKVLVLGSWNGCLLYEYLTSQCDVKHFDFVDVNKNVHKDRDYYFSTNKMKKNYTSIVEDATSISHEGYDLVINTSCEHMPDIQSIYGPLYALQSNNYVDIPEHSNCVKSAKELAGKWDINETAHKDKLNMGSYTRFLVIGCHY